MDLDVSIENSAAVIRHYERRLCQQGLTEEIRDDLQKWLLMLRNSHDWLVRLKTAIENDEPCPDPPRNGAPC